MRDDFTRSFAVPSFAEKSSFNPRPLIESFRPLFKSVEVSSMDTSVGSPEQLRFSAVRNPPGGTAFA